MSVLIEGMDMPRSCEECDLLDCNDSCQLLGDVDESIENGSRDLRCPLVEVIATPFDKKRDELETLERIRSGGGLLPLVDIDVNKWRTKNERKQMEIYRGV